VPITVSSLAPFASFIAAYSSATPNYRNLQRNLRRFFPVNGSRFGLLTLAVPSHAGLNSTYAFHVKEKRAATWGGGNTVIDELNHLVAYFAFGQFALIYVSDSESKAAMHDALFTNQIAGWEPVDERVLVSAFVTGSALRTLWLGGSHRAVTIRPSSKILSGENLADAIDPFGDSTFVAGAVRSAKAGVSLKRSGIWFGPKRDWNGMCATALTVLRELDALQANIATLSASVHAGLAQNVLTFAGVGPAYEIEWADPATLNGKTRSNELARLRERYELEIGTTTVASKDVSVNITDTTSSTTASVVLQPDFSGTRLIVSVAGTVPPAMTEVANAITADPGFVRVYYESWHTLADATLTLAKVQDRPFLFEFLDFAPGTPYKVSQEKPPGKRVVLARMFNTSDVSLFKWVFKDGLGQLGLSQPHPGRTWLYCDDGAGEVADFIHVDLRSGGTAAVPKITLIHVKGANSSKPSRRISAGAYEVVTAQAMKNLRRMISAEMLVEIIKTVTKHGGTRVWDHPWAVGLTSSHAVGDALLAALGSIRANCGYEVIIVQPHLLQSKYVVSGSPSNDTGAVQLRSLLFGAKAMTQAAGAEFRVVCDAR
jgi:hypothetical protein